MRNFIKDCLRTESTRFCNLEDGEGKDYNKERLIHACMGMQTETAEFTDALKKAIFYGKTLDVVNLKEELGYLLWYEILPKIEIITASVLQLLVPIIAIFLSILFLDESLTLELIVSTILILVGIFIALKRKRV